MVITIVADVLDSNQVLS